MIELLMAVSMMVVIAGVMGALSMAIQIGSQHSQAEATATQHARVALQRIERALQEATASEQFPGCIVLSKQVGSWTFPDTLVVWNPRGAAVDPDGLPRINELVIFCPDPSEPNLLLEITYSPSNAQVPAYSDIASWESVIDAIKKSNSSQRTELTNLLRTASVDDDSGNSSQRGLARFITTINPSTDQWDNYKLGFMGWDELAWPQDIYSNQTGLRQVACNIELMLMPSHKSAENDPDGQASIPFLGSAAIYYDLQK